MPSMSQGCPWLCPAWLSAVSYSFQIFFPCCHSIEYTVLYCIVTVGRVLIKKSSYRLSPPHGPCPPPPVWHPETSTIIRTCRGTLATQFLFNHRWAWQYWWESRTQWHRAALQWGLTGLLNPDKLVARSTHSGTQSVLWGMVLSFTRFNWTKNNMV